MRKPDYVRKHFAPLLDKTLQKALAHRLATQFPSLGGPRILDLCADMILEVLDQHLRPRESLTHGQVLWLGIDVDDPPARGKCTANTELVPLILDLSTASDVQAIIDRKPSWQRVLAKALRLSQQAYEQGALLSNSDLAELLNADAGHVSHLIAEYERSSGQLVPRRATVHDVGTGLTHKRIICWKRYAEGKAPGQIARETYHTLEAVDRYLAQFDRVRCCHLEGMPVAQIAFTLQCGPSLVREYLAIHHELEAARAAQA